MPARRLRSLPVHQDRANAIDYHRRRISLSAFSTFPGSFFLETICLFFFLFSGILISAFRPQHMPARVPYWNTVQIGLLRLLYSPWLLLARNFFFLLSSILISAFHPQGMPTRVPHRRTGCGIQCTSFCPQTAGPRTLAQGALGRLG